MSSFFIADPLHINKKNFASLYEYLSESKATVSLHEGRRDWITLAGDYSQLQAELSDDYASLSELSAEALLAKSLLGVNLFDAARAEHLMTVITDACWSSSRFPTSRTELFGRLNDAFRERLLWNMAAAANWLKYWSNHFDRIPTPDFVLVFSGSSIYAKTLLGLMKSKPPRTFVLESFFTGNDYYIEEKYDHLANNSNLAQVAYYRSMHLPEGQDERDKERNKALNKVFAMRNKNVTQPAPSEVQLFDNDKPVLTIVGQVVNDFSLLESGVCGIHSLEVYMDLIDALLEHTDYNIVFKCHPWERKKVGLLCPFTKERLIARYHHKAAELAEKEGSNVVQASPMEHSAGTRIAIVEDINLKSLYKISKVIVGLNSQGLLEAAFEGFRPVQFGNAFFGRKGFTSDYGVNEINRFITDLSSPSFPGRLDLAGYREFEAFLTRALQCSLVAATPSGKVRLRTIFEVRRTVKLTPNPSKAAPAPAPVTAGVAVKSKKAEVQVSQVPRSQEAGSPMRRKLQKLRRSPKKFFLDSKIPVLRPLHVLFQR